MARDRAVDLRRIDGDRLRLPHDRAAVVARVQLRAAALTGLRANGRVRFRCRAAANRSAPAQRPRHSLRTLSARWRAPEWRRHRADATAHARYRLAACLGNSTPYPTLKHDSQGLPRDHTTQPLAPESAPAPAAARILGASPYVPDVPHPRSGISQTFGGLPTEFRSREMPRQLRGEQIVAKRRIRSSRPVAGRPERRWCHQIRRNSTAPRRCRVAWPCAAPDR